MASRIQRASIGCGGGARLLMHELLGFTARDQGGKRRRGEDAPYIHDGRLVLPGQHEPAVLDVSNEHDWVAGLGGSIVRPSVCRARQGAELQALETAEEVLPDRCSQLPPV